MKIICYTVFIIIFTALLSVAQTMANYQKATLILQKSLRATGNGDSKSFSINTKGVIHNLGHYEVPGKTEDIPYEETGAFFEKEHSGYTRSSMLYNGYTFVELVVSKEDSVYKKGFYENKLSKGKNPDQAFELARKAPLWLLQLAWASRVTLRCLGGDSSYEWLSFGTRPVTLFINKKTHLLDRVEYLGYDDLYGDVVFATSYKDYKDDHGVKMPGLRIDYEFDKPEREMTYEALRSDVQADTSDLKITAVPEYFRKKMAAAVVEKDSLIFERIAVDIELIKVSSQNNKMLVVEFADYLAIFEVPAGIMVNNQVLGALQDRYPGKKLKYLFVTHHHPDHAGGLKAYAATPLTIVTTAGNKAYFEDVMKKSHTMSNELIDNAQNSRFDFVALNGEKNFADKIVAYEIGKSTGHTDEHLVYYFPTSGMLWTGDLLSFSSDERVTPAGERGSSVYDLIMAKKLKVNRIYTSWPLKGQREFGTLEELRKMVEIK